MNVLLVTPHKGELSPYFLNQQVEMIKSLREEIAIRGKNIETSILPLHLMDLDEMPMKEVTSVLENNRKIIEKADIVHSFSALPLHFRPYFKNTLLMTLNLERMGEKLKNLLPDPNQPGIEMTTSLKHSRGNTFQEFLPGFNIDLPAEEFSFKSKNFVIFASSRAFVDDSKKEIRKIAPDAEFFVRFRSETPLIDDEKAFKIDLLNETSFLLGLTEGNNEKEIDLLPLKVLSKGIPVFLVDAPFEKRFYPDFLHLSDISHLADQYGEIERNYEQEKELRDDLHSFACRYFFFSKMADDSLRVYSSLIQNKKKAEKRPWGEWESLKLKDNYKVKYIFVEPNEKLSLQFHKHREEIWTVVEGDGYVTVDEDVFEASRSDMFIIKKEQKHRAEGGKNGLHIIEIQTGDYLGEDDIVRLEDAYGRK